ncbi:hypothetical protein IOMTU133_1114 [Pseudomonas aeruginosa]|nr:hypothetical protein IOMTU133_1114 [Pseudomonas aeruginosa]
MNQSAGLLQRIAPGVGSEMVGQLVTRDGLCPLAVSDCSAQRI